MRKICFTTLCRLLPTHNYLLQSECRIIMPIPQTPENLVLQAVMDEFEENREKGNLTAEILNKEKVW